MEKNSCKVCVTGGAGYIASLLVKKLLDEGCVVHATLRNLDDRLKVDILKSFCGAGTRLRLFDGDIYRAEEFEEPIQGCEFVLLHKTRVDATVDSARRIATACIKSGMVRRLIYTASVVAASPLKDDGIWL